MSEGIGVAHAGVGISVTQVIWVMLWLTVFSRSHYRRRYGRDRGDGAGHSTRACRLDLLAIISQPQ